MLDSLKEGTLDSRSSVMYFLEDLGFKLERVTEKSISISRPDMKRNIRLKGAIYEEGFQALSQRAEIIESMQSKYERLSDSRGNRDLMTWEKGMEIKKEYHGKLYGDIKAPEPLKLSVHIVKDTTKSIKEKSVLDTSSSNTYSYTPNL